MHSLGCRPRDCVDWGVGLCTVQGVGPGTGWTGEWGCAQSIGCRPRDWVDWGVGLLHDLDLEAVP